MCVGCCSILLVCPIIAKNLASILDSNWQDTSLIYLSWSMVHLSRITNGPTPFEQTSSHIITFSENFRFCFLPPFSSASSRFKAHVRLFWALPTPSISNIFSSGNKIFNVPSFLKFVLSSICKIFFFSIFQYPSSVEQFSAYMVKVLDHFSIPDEYLVLETVNHF